MALLAAGGLMLTAPFAMAQESSPLQRFLEQVDREWPGESYQQTINARMLELLADAVEDLARRSNLSSVKLAKDIATFREDTRTYLAGTPGKAEQSERLERAFRSAGDMIERLVESAGLEGRPFDRRLSAVKRAAGGIDEDDPLIRQPDVIERFFRHTAELLDAFAAARLQRPAH